MAPTTSRCVPSCRLATLCAVFLCIAIPGGCHRAEPLRSSSADIVISTEDGVTIRGALYSPQIEKPPGLLLLHVLGSNRNDWAEFGERARRAGYMCLAIDFRGHGDSGVPAGVDGNYKAFADAHWQGFLFDVAAGRRALIEAGADPENIGIVGASIGANAGLAYADAYDGVHALVMISPGLRYKTFAIAPLMRETRGLPILLITSEGDTYSASSCRTLKEAAPGFCELRAYPGSAHGTDLLVAARASVDQILVWLDGTVGKGLAP